MNSYSSSTSGLSSWQSTSSTCICCGAHLSVKESICRQCSAPTALSHSASSNSDETNFISVLGASNAGKTVFLGLLLDLLSKEGGAMSGAPTSTFSVNLQEQVITALERREFPEKTPSEPDMWNWVHCELTLRDKKNSRSLELISPDLAGEAIAAEVQQIGTYPLIQQVVKRSNGVMILCDSIRVRTSSSAEDLFAMKLAAYVAQLHNATPGERAGSRSDSAGRRAAAGPSLAIVLTKSDACPEALVDPVGFAANNMPRLYEFCRRTFSRHQYFAASVAGNTALISEPGRIPQRIPLHIQPQGVVEPLNWLVS